MAWCCTKPLLFLVYLFFNHIRTMKKIFYLGLIALFASCIKKDPPAPTGEIKVRFVNAVLGSTPQDMFVNGIKDPNSAPLNYGQFSPYFTATSGDNAFAFAEVGTTEGLGNAGTRGTFSIGDNASVFYFRLLERNGSELAAGITLDDNTPVEGKAKVKFMHLNSNLDNFISFLQEDPADDTKKIAIDPGVAFANASKYYTLEPGAKLFARATGMAEDLLINVDLKAGKNYTIWIDGPSDSELVSHPILQN